MTPVIVFYERVYNLGNYENERIGVQISVPEDSTVDEAWKVARFMVDEEHKRGKAGATIAPAAAQEVQPTDVVLTFGKYSGVALGDLVERDLGYLEWLAAKALKEDIRLAALNVLTEYDNRVRATAVQSDAASDDIPF